MVQQGEKKKKSTGTYKLIGRDSNTNRIIRKEGIKNGKAID